MVLDGRIGERGREREPPETGRASVLRWVARSEHCQRKVCQRRRKSVGGQRGFRVAVAGGDGSGGGSGVVLSNCTVGWNFRSSAQHRETVRIRSRRPGGWQGPLDSVGYGKLARVTEFPSPEHDEGTTQEVAREFDYREHDYDDNCGADDRCQDDCDDCQHEDRIAAKESNDDDDDDCENGNDDENNVRDEQNAANDYGQVDDPRHADDDVEDGSSARSDCCCSRKFLVPRAVEDLCCCAVRIITRLTGRASTTSCRYVTDSDRDRDRDRVDDGDEDEDEDENEDEDEDDEDDDDDDDDDYDDSNNNDDDDVHDDVGDMCGCATSTRRGLGTAAGKSARRAKSSCSVHRTPGIR
ncbi:hypothetical protein ALC56_13174 [Trachymyrmex septentrionalis]|uniref:Replicase polyprotein 1a n=1 Tax=Trachymyrmex septentrionalis TaxID=34720 RepID=A0A195EWP1_9HYME|nr:hypothetical protein ALC56_13174 [Trachymyrmex septentrionalis]